jgi:putative membrane protein insertion efficiency factor
MKAPMKALLIGLIRGYQVVLSPWVGNQCRHWPTCSDYARQAIGRHGAARGSWLAARRVLRCNPWHEGGIDPVPDEFHWR